MIKARPVIRVVALAFMLVGGLLVSFSSSDPAPRDGWVNYTGAFVGAEFTDTRKSGRVATISIDGADGEPQFMLTHTERRPEFEPTVRSFAPGEVVTISAVPRGQAGWTAPEGQPLYLLVLHRGDELVYDRDRDGAGGAWIATVVRVLGYLMAGGFFIVLLMTFRRRG